MGTAIVLAVFVALLAPFPLCVRHQGRPGARLADEVEAWLRSRHRQLPGHPAVPATGAEKRQVLARGW